MVIVAVFHGVENRAQKNPVTASERQCLYVAPLLRLHGEGTQVRGAATELSSSLCSALTGCDIAGLARAGLDSFLFTPNNIS